MTAEIKRLRAETDAEIRDIPPPYSTAKWISEALAAERAAVDAVMRDIIHATGLVVQEARHHRLSPLLAEKLDELERMTTLDA